MLGLREGLRSPTEIFDLDLSVMKLEGYLWRALKYSLDRGTHNLNWISQSKNAAFFRGENAWIFRNR